MRKVFLGIILLACACLSHGQLAISVFDPATAPVGGCPGSATETNAWCAFQHDVLPNKHGVAVSIRANTVDTGSCVGAVCTPNYSGWSTADAPQTMYTTGYAITSISTTAGTATANMSSGSYGPGDWICNQGTSVAAYNHCFQLLTATYVSNVLSTVTWTQSGSPASATGGNMLESCGANLASGAQQCHVEYIIQHNTGTGPNGALPTYVASQAWANQACQTFGWVASANHPIGDCIFVGSHYYEATTSCATNGYCTSGSTAPGTWNTSGGTTTDGTITWLDDGTTNARPLDVVTQTAGYPGINLSFNLTAVANASGGSTVYTGTITGGAASAYCTSPSIYYFVITGFTHGADNGTFQCTSSTPTTLTLNNASGVSESGATATAASNTPTSAVFNLNSTGCTGGVCNVAQVASGEPMVFESQYLAWINGFNNNVIAHYAAVAWSAIIDYIRLGLIGGGEAFPYASSVISGNYGWTDTQMSNVYVKAGAATYKANSLAWIANGSPSFSLMASLNQNKGGCSTFATCVIMPQGLAYSAVVLPGYTALGSQGLQAADITGWPSTSNTSNEFIYVLSLLHPKLKWMEQQTLKESTGPGSSGCSAQQTQTGPLDVLMIFATEHWTNVFEVYGADDLATYSSGFGTGYTFGNGCSPYPTSYDLAFTNASNGVPNATMIMFGNSKMFGNAQTPK